MNKSLDDKAHKLILFQSKEIRRLWHDDECVFSVIDVMAALTDSVNPRDYWYKMKIRVNGEEGFEPSTVCRQLKMQAPDGKNRLTDCADTEGILRIIYTLMNKFSFQLVNSLFILGRNTPAMPLNDAQIGGFFYARSRRA
jgi:hypothetical protein